MAFFILIIERIKRKRDQRKIAQIKIKKESIKARRCTSLTVKENIINEPFRTLTAY